MMQTSNLPTLHWKHLKIQDVSKLWDPEPLSITTWSNHLQILRSPLFCLSAISSHPARHLINVLNLRHLDCPGETFVRLVVGNDQEPCRKRMLQWWEPLSFVETYHRKPFVPGASYGHLRVCQKTPTSNIVPVPPQSPLHAFFHCDMAMGLDGNVDMVIHIFHLSESPTVMTGWQVRRPTPTATRLACSTSTVRGTFVTIGTCTCFCTGTWRISSCDEELKML